MVKKQRFTREQLNAAMDTAYRRYRNRENFTGVDVGYLWNGENRTDQPTIRLHVISKQPLDELDPETAFPAEIDGVPLDVIEGPYRITYASGCPKPRAPILLGGVSIGRLDNGSGTAGAIVIDEQTGNPGVLSNWHVLAGPNAGVGDPILQPGRVDGGNQDDLVARLTRWMLDSDGDAAVAELTMSRPWLPVQIESFTTFTGSRNAELGETLVKHGRSTGKTTARVDGVGIYRAEFEVQPGKYEHRDIEGFKLVPEDAGNPDDIEVSDSGDSGAIWYSESDGTAVGLHFAGETETDPRAERAIACHAPRVFARLGVRPGGYNDLIELTRRQDVASKQMFENGAIRQDAFSPAQGYPWLRPSLPTADPRLVAWSGQPNAFDGRYYTDTDVVGMNGGYMTLESPGNGAVGIGKPNATVVVDMWHRLKESLLIEHYDCFNSVMMGDAIEIKIGGNMKHYEVANIVRNHRKFEDVLPSYPTGSFFEDCVTYQHVCRKLAVHAGLI